VPSLGRGRLSAHSLSCDRGMFSSFRLAFLTKVRTWRARRRAVHGDVPLDVACALPFLPFEHEDGAVNRVVYMAVLEIDASEAEAFSGRRMSNKKGGGDPFWRLVSFPHPSMSS